MDGLSHREAVGSVNRRQVADSGIGALFVKILEGTIGQLSWAIKVVVNDVEHAPNTYCSLSV